MAGSIAWLLGPEGSRWDLWIAFGVGSRIGICLASGIVMLWKEHSSAAFRGFDIYPCGFETAHTCFLTAGAK